jgi:PadR family transcriptional regulator
MYRPSSMIAKELVAASSRPLVLSLLAERESYGYEIIQRIREVSLKKIEWTEGMLYPVLHRLERENLLESEWKPSEAGRERKYYRLTRDGRRAIAAEREQWMAVHYTLEKLWTPKPALI